MIEAESHFDLTIWKPPLYQTHQHDILYIIPMKERKVLFMKKMLALLLVLCMALASIPALAETDFTGTWYLILAGMTCGTFELNADGTCVGTTAASDEEKKLNGTWSAEGDLVTLTISEESLPLTFDGTDLTFGTEEVATPKDGTTIDFPLKFSREPGEVTTDELTAYASDGTVPEGKKKEDIEKVLDQVGLLFLAAVESVAIEATYSGTWYLNVMGITCGTFELNADGTCVGTSTASGEEKKLNGTWSAEGDVVTITIREQPLTLFFTGLNLVVYDADTPELASLLKFSRESGITVDELKAYTSDGTIPEGKTKEEMENVQNQLGLLFIVAGLMN